MNRTESLYARKTVRIAGILVLFAYMVFQIIDLVEDRRHGTAGAVIFVEALCSIASVLLLLYLLRVALKSKEESHRLEKRMALLEKENLDWKNRTSTYVRGLNVAIDQQLTAWQLSPAEKEIALLLLRGITGREIARLRRTSEHTIKQQTSAVYRKAGFKARAEMSAFFLGDLLEPVHPEEHPLPTLQSAASRNENPPASVEPIG